MSYSFDTEINRRGTGAVKWNVPDSELPLWVADMDFPTAPEILEALQARLDQGIFGYMEVPDDWYDAYIHWWKTRHRFEMDRSWLLFCTGVIPAISSTIRKLTTPGENVLIQTPVYNIFYNCIRNNGCHIVRNRLQYISGRYEIDFADLEAKLSDPQTSLMLLCNPHNPTGNLWSAGTLQRIGELCKAHHVTVVSDEIHCDLTLPDYEYTPFASVSETCRDISITCIAPSKTFNIASLQTAAICVPNPTLRHKVWRAINTDEVAEAGAFALPAAIAAFQRGGPWLDALRVYLADNRRFVESYLHDYLPQVTVTEGQATYLLWLHTGVDSHRLAPFLREQAGVFLSPGHIFGDDGEEFLRLNIACPCSTLQEGLARLRHGIELYFAYAKP